MRVMVIVKATKNSEAGALPDEKLLAAMGKYNEELVKAGVKIPDVMNGAAKATVNLAAAGEIDLPQAAMIASNAMRKVSHHVITASHRPRSHRRCLRRTPG